jgi:hypothetical protein
MLNSKLDWLQQLSYAVTVQQSAVMESVQRLRRQAQAAGQLATTPQQVVGTEDQEIVIAPAQPDVLYVPVYDPSVVYGGWPYPLYPPVYLAPPPWYYGGPVLGIGLVFGVGIPIFGGLWGWARPNWRGGGFYVDVNRYNRINVNRPPIRNSGWRAPGPSGRLAGGFHPPMTGPVGRPPLAGGLPANAIGRPNVSVPGGVVRPPAGMGPANRPPIGQGGNFRAGGAQFAPGHGTRPSGGAALRPSTRPAGGGSAAFGGINEGGAAAQFQNRGAQSRQQVSRPSGGGGHPQGGGGGRSQGGNDRRGR